MAGIRNCTDDRLESFNPSFQRSRRSFAPTTHVKPSQLLADNGPLGLWADLSVESRNRGTEAKGPSLRQLRAVDTPVVRKDSIRLSSIERSMGLRPTALGNPRINNVRPHNDSSAFQDEDPSPEFVVSVSQLASLTAEEQ